MAVYTAAAVPLCWLTAVQVYSIAMCDVSALCTSYGRTKRRPHSFLFLIYYIKTASSHFFGFFPYLISFYTPTVPN
jgi:hypothetical protein